MSIETTAAGGAVGAIFKILGVPLAAGAIATAFAFLFMWPKTLKEAGIRLACTILSSFTAGPFLVIAVHSWSPGLFTSACQLATMYKLPEEIGTLFVSAPFLIVAGVPAWWIVGAAVLWLDKRRGKDLGEIARDAAEVVHEVRGAL
jgi:hypothetical protein